MSGQDAKSRRSPTILREQTRAEEAVWRGAADGKLGRLACENFIAQMVQLLHNTTPDTRHLDRSQSEQGSTAGSRSQAQAGVMASDAIQYATKSLGSKMPSSSPSLVSLPPPSITLSIRPCI